VLQEAVIDDGQPNWVLARDCTFPEAVHVAPDAKAFGCKITAVFVPPASPRVPMDVRYRLEPAPPLVPLWTMLHVLLHPTPPLQPFAAL